MELQFIWSSCIGFLPLATIRAVDEEGASVGWHMGRGPKTTEGLLTCWSALIIEKGLAISTNSMYTTRH